MSDELDPVHEWVLASNSEAEQRLRQAVHTTLVAVSSVEPLRESMFLKGGILLAIRYGGLRHTKDVDFSATGHYADFDKEEFIDRLSEGLVTAVDELSYELDCRIQGTPRADPHEDRGDFHNLKFKIGYAPKGTREHRRMLTRGHTSSALSVDYSFNEPVVSSDIVTMASSKRIQTYGLIDIVAEKLRAMIQQPIRNRQRRQDVYDLYALLEARGAELVELRSEVLDVLRRKAEAREVEVSARSLDDDEVRHLSSLEYPDLQAELPHALPSFALVYAGVNEYYHGLPWLDNA